MRWVVTVSDPLNQVVLNEFENGARVPDGEIGIRRFDAPTVVPPGISKNLNLYVKQSVAQIPPRAIIQLAIDGHPVFWGPAIITPPLTAPGAGPADSDRDALERITVTGGEQLLRESILGPRLWTTDTDVADIALELCQLYAHPALTVDEANFLMTGAVLNVFYRPESTLADALKALTDTASVYGCWVDATGAVRYDAKGGS